MPLGNPITIENESRIISVTTTTTNDTFTIEGGYKINHINVYRNGIRLTSGNDFLANDNATVQLINSPNIGDIIEFHLFDEFLVNDAIVGAASSQTIYGDLVVNGTLYTNNNVTVSNSAYADVAGIATVAEGLTGTPNISVGEITTSGVINAGGNINGNVTGDVTGDLTGNADTATSATNAQGLTGTPDITVRNIVGAAATFSGSVSVAGTVTYQDVSAVDSVGIITARSGIDVTGRDINITSGGVNAAGVITATEYDGYLFLDNQLF